MFSLKLMLSTKKKIMICFQIRKKGKDKSIWTIFFPTKYNSIKNPKKPTSDLNKSIAGQGHEA